MNRFDENSSFVQIVAAIAEAKHQNKERVDLDLSVLVGIVSEVEEVRETLKGLRDKYTGVKVSAKITSNNLVCTSHVLMP